MKERSIMFKQPHANEMVRAILDDRKTQLRVPMKEQPHEGSKFHGMVQCFGELRALFWCEGQPSNYGTPLPMHVGDRLWVKETWRCRGGREYEYQKHQPSIMYCAEAEPVEAICNEWRPSIHMPRWASRIDLEITRVWVERVQDITEEDVWKEGWQSLAWIQDKNGGLCKFAHWGEYWNSIYGTWDANPWVWVYEFRRIKP